MIGYMQICSSMDKPDAHEYLYKTHKIIKLKFHKTPRDMCCKRKKEHQGQCAQSNEQHKHQTIANTVRIHSRCQCHIYHAARKYAVEYACPNRTSRTIQPYAHKLDKRLYSSGMKLCQNS